MVLRAGGSENADLATRGFQSCATFLDSGALRDHLGIELQGQGPLKPQSRLRASWQGGGCQAPRQDGSPAKDAAIHRQDFGGDPFNIEVKLCYEGATCPSEGPGTSLYRFIKVNLVSRSCYCGPPKVSDLIRKVLKS